MSQRFAWKGQPRLNVGTNHDDQQAQGPVKSPGHLPRLLSRTRNATSPRTVQNTRLSTFRTVSFAIPSFSAGSLGSAAGQRAGKGSSVVDRLGCRKLWLVAAPHRTFSSLVRLQVQMRRRRLTEIRICPAFRRSRSRARLAAACRSSRALMRAGCARCCASGRWRAHTPPASGPRSAR